MYLNKCCDNHTSPILNAEYSVFDVRFKNWGVLLGYILGYPSVLSGRFKSRDTFRPIGREKKYFLYHDGFYLRGSFITLLQVVFSWYVALANSISLYFTHYCIYGCTPFGFFIVLN